VTFSYPGITDTRINFIALARSPSTDRPASSRLVTTKLTAVAQPSAASTSGWLRSTPGTSATPTPSPSSPQPSANDASTVSPVAAPTLQQSLKRRPGEFSAPNGSTSSASSAQQHGIKPVWGRVPPTQPKSDLARGPAGKEIQNDFPTAAEAAHGMCLFSCLLPWTVTAIKSDIRGFPWQHFCLIWAQIEQAARPRF
jgi:hypothetical protein